MIILHIEAKSVSWNALAAKNRWTYKRIKDEWAKNTSLNQASKKIRKRKNWMVFRIKSFVLIPLVFLRDTLKSETVEKRFDSASAK